MMIERGKHLVFTHLRGKSVLAKVIRKRLGAERIKDFVAFDDNDMALEWCEHLVFTG